VVNFAGAAFELELCLCQDGRLDRVTAIRQDVILKIVETVEAAGTRFAAPTQLLPASDEASAYLPLGMPRW
jgi:hypothetical protein